MRKFRYIKCFKSRCWRECVICHHHYKKEFLWRVLIPFKYLALINHTYYICQNCKNNESDVENWRTELISEINK